MERLIKFDNIIAVQKINLIRCLRVIFEDENEQLLQLRLKIKVLDLELEKYQLIESDITKHIIESMLSVATISDRMDLPIVNRIVASSSKIAIMTRRGPGNFVIFSESMAEKIIKDSDYYHIVSDKHYVSPYLKEGCLVGYKGPGEFDGGLVLSIIDNKFQIGNIEGSERYYVYIKGE